MIKNARAKFVKYTTMQNFHLENDWEWFCRLQLIYSVAKEFYKAQDIWSLLWQHMALKGLDIYKEMLLKKRSDQWDRV